MLVYRAGPSLVVRDARSLAPRARLPIRTPLTENLTADGPQGSILIAPDRRTVYYAYWLVDPGGQPAEAYLAHWSLLTGRRMAPVRVGRGPLLATGLVDRGTRLMVATEHEIATYDPHTLRLIRSVAIRPAPLLPSAAAFSRDGATLALGTQAGSVWLINVATGRARRAAGGHRAAVAGVVFTRDGRRVMTAGDDGRVIARDAVTGAQDAVLPGPAGRVQDVQLSPDGSTLYTAAVGGVLLAWDLTGQRGFGHSTRLSAALPCCDPVAPPRPALALSPDGSRFAVPTGAATVGVFSTRTLRQVATFTIRPPEGLITALAWSPAGGMLAVGARGGMVQLWSVDGAPRHVRSLSDLTALPGQSEAIQSLVFSPDGRLLAGSDKAQTTSLGHTSTALVATLAIWRVATGGTVTPPTDLGGGNSLNGSDVVAFSPDGKRVAASLLTGGVRVYDPFGGQLVRTLSDPGDDAISLAFGPSGILAEGTLGGTVELWNPATGKRLAQPLLADSVAITSVAFDPTGRRFATAGSGDGTIKVWFTAGLQQEGPRLAADPDATSAVAFDPGGKDLLVVDDRGGAFAWPTSLPAWQQDACTLAGRNLTRAEWAQFVAGRPYTAVCR